MPRANGSSRGRRTQKAAKRPGVLKGQALSARERDCLGFVAQGMSDGEIAERLRIAPSTAHFYVEKAKQKLGARTRAQAVAHLIAAGLY